MLHHKKNAFLKFFSLYFISVALLILASGFFYFEQTKAQFLKKEHFSLIEYAREIKMGDKPPSNSSIFHHEFVIKKGKTIDIRNFTVTKDKFIKYIPTNRKNYYLKVTKTKKIFEKELFNLKAKILLMQLLLLAIFAVISYYLAKSAIKPLEESIDTLDKFAKDLIHDLNTPVTAMKLNIKLLEKNPLTKDIKALSRLKKSIDTISELRENLTILLEKKTFQITNVNICEIVKDVILLHQPNYRQLRFDIDCENFFAKTNPNALKQILHNLVSNACKYNKPNGYVKIYTKDTSLYIEDSGVGIKEPEKVFDREYSAQNSSGLGLDIAKRLCDAMGLKIEVRSTKKGSVFILKDLKLTLS
ncbi:MAG: HAMP domain-containing histidine kinase [Epsilonproteobacteria bacterium]|nr:HAMP domain-containing histidine kinase [Campylobacterota bacterium]